MKKNQSGFAVLELVLLVVVVGIIGVVGWKVMSMNKSTNDSASSTGTTKTTAAESISGVPDTVPEIKKTADLDTASKTLDSTDPDGSSTDLASLETQLSAF
jgi:cytoskeletal protein RodZ